MKKLVIVILSVLLIFSFCGCHTEKQEETSPKEEIASTEESAEPEKDLSLINQLREDYNFGTCKKLSGNVAVILFYMDDFESSWTDAETDRFTQNEVLPGLDFLEQEAKKHGIELNLTVKGSYSSIYYGDEVITSVGNTGFATADVLWEAAVQINYSSSAKMIEAFKSKYKTDEAVCFTIFNKGGTSYAINPKRDADMKVDEHCIVFARELNTVKNGPDGQQAAVVAHEMLHLYGAEDFYASAPRKSLAKKYYPSDIMLSAAYDIKTNTIEAATAFYIGWTDTVPSVIEEEGWYAG